ncbi:hypothetical protein BG006_011284 [Podila minutissima]|uniref:Leucine-rich repeat-containing protein n=1 Tax=Podila minutissima TaxID=64525 RepID=A0A9P5VI73_9FUNG|nr:hypothetical protein BG006_011284 [Podila minutissima]
MDTPIEGDSYVRTLSHYLRSNQRRLLPQPTSTSGNATARAILMPADPMAAAYQSMMASLWTATTQVVNSITPPPDGRDTPDKDLYDGAWDGTGSIAADTSPRERQLHLQAQLKAPILPLDLYYLMYILERFEEVGIELDRWEGLTPCIVGDSTPRVIKSDDDDKDGVPNPITYPSFPTPAATRPQSIRSFQSTAISTLTLITGWKQWSAASSQENITITDDIHFIHRFMKKVPGLRLVSKIPPGLHVQGRGRIDGYSANAILNLFSTGQDGMSKPMQLPVLSLFPALTHLEIHKIPPRCIDGWEVLMKQLRSLVVVQADIEDVYDVMVAAVVNSERRRRQKHFKEQNRAVQIMQEQQEALKDAALVSKEIDTIQEEEEGETENTTTTNGSSEGEVGSLGASASVPMITSISLPEEELDDSTILASLEMWPHLHHLSLTDNGLPALAHNDTFSYTHSVVSLDLSHNLLLSPPSGLIHLHNLHELNLSYNMISGVQSIYQILGNISVLDLRGNRLESLSGLERLWNLEKVDVRENHLDEAAEVGRLAALPQIREVWAERNPFCVIQQKHRLEILAVFKANGHDLLLDGTFASFTERRSLANLSPSSFSTTISSINNVANIPAASAPAATLSKELAPSHQHYNSGEYPTRPVSWHVSGTSPPMGGPAPPVSKLVKKKLMKASNRVKRVVNLDSDHEEDTATAVHEGEVKGIEILLSDNEIVSPRVSLLGSPVAIKKPKKKKSPKGDTTLSPKDDEAINNKANLRVKKKASKKKSINFVADDTITTSTTSHSHPHPEDSHATTSGDDVDHSLCRGGHHVHRLAHLERSLATVQFERPSSSNFPAGSSPDKPSQHMRHPSRGILKRAQTMGIGGANIGLVLPGPASPTRPLRPSSPIGSMSSDDGGADGYRRRIEAMRNEAGSNWLKVLAEMDKDILHTRDDSHL